MKTEANNRKRLMGYFGVAVTTLLTPGGKLFTSAMAAATVVAGVAMLAKDPPNASTGKTSAPSVAQTTPAFNSTELLGLSDIPASEAGYDPLVATAPSYPVSSQAVLSSYQPSIGGGSGVSSVPVANIPAPTTPLSNGGPVIVVGRGFPQPPGSGEPPEASGNPLATPEVPALIDPKEPEIIAGPSDEPRTPAEPEIIIAEAFPEDDPLKSPDVLPVSPPPRNNDPLITETNLPGLQPLITTALLPIPSTLGLFLLGLVNLGWLYRRRAI